jgi:NadR type nicotinamide-nucleotide adenylyltransferase
MSYLSSSATSRDKSRRLLRAEWLREIHAAQTNVRVLITPDDLPDDDSPAWARRTLEILGRAPDMVFTSEDYGEPFSRALGCRHLCVDQARRAVPISGTAIRQNPWRHWEFLEAPVRAYYARRVCLVGAESTGTTTLAEGLAEHFQTVWVPEYGREYCETHQKVGDHASEWQSEEFEMIAHEQNRREDEMARECNRVLICDTNAWTTRLWHRRYLNYDSPAVEKLAARPYDLYLLTGDEIPFVQDGLRDGENIRHTMHKWFEAELQAQKVPWALLRGAPEQRLAQAATLIEQLLG